MVCCCPVYKVTIWTSHSNIYIKDFASERIWGRRDKIIHLGDTNPIQSLVSETFKPTTVDFGGNCKDDGKWHFKQSSNRIDGELISTVHLEFNGNRILSFKLEEEILIGREDIYIKGSEDDYLLRYRSYGYPSSIDIFTQNFKQIELALKAKYNNRYCFDGDLRSLFKYGYRSEKYYKEYRKKREFYCAKI